MNQPKLVIFDCDGVLVDSEPATISVLLDDLTKRGLTLTEKGVNDLFVGGSIMTAGDQVRQLGAEIPDNWADLIYAQIYELLRKGVKTIDGIEELMDRLDAKSIPYCVGSNGSEEKMEITLGQHPSLQQRLAGKLYSAHTYAVSKPDPELFLIAARDFKVAPQDCVVVDDSPTGCTAAKRAGMRCFGLAEHDDGSRLAAQGADVIHSLNEIAPLLGLE